MIEPAEGIWATFQLSGRVIPGRMPCIWKEVEKKPELTWAHSQTVDTACVQSRHTVTLGDTPPHMHVTVVDIFAILAWSQDKQQSKYPIHFNNSRAGEPFRGRSSANCQLLFTSEIKVDQLGWFIKTLWSFSSGYSSISNVLLFSKSQQTVARSESSDAVTLELAWIASTSRKRSVPSWDCWQCR